MKQKRTIGKGKGMKEGVSRQRKGKRKKGEEERERKGRKEGREGGEGREGKYLLSYPSAI